MGLGHSRRSVGKMTVIPKCASGTSSGYGGIVKNSPPFVVGEGTTDLRAHLKFGFHLQEFNTIEQQEMNLSHSGSPHLAKERKLATEEAKKPANISKNRYSFVVPFDSTRVKLQVSEDPFEQSDYINANYVQGEDTSFIATQGPLPHTISDFWRMIWETQTGVIVMLTKEKEGHRTKCDRYWPKVGDPPEMFRHGNLRLELVSSEEDPELQLITRTFTLTHSKQRQALTTSNHNNGTLDYSSSSLPSVSPTFSGPGTSPSGTTLSSSPSSSSSSPEEERRTVIQLQFLGWPDHGVPEHPQSLLNLVHKLDTLRQNKNMQTKPVAVHCSAGIGRTGAFCAVHIHVTKLNKHRTQQKQKSGQTPTSSPAPSPLKFDIFQTVTQLRRQRIGMVQQPEQYRLIYETLILESEKLS